MFAKAESDWQPGYHCCALGTAPRNHHDCVVYLCIPVYLWVAKAGCYSALRKYSAPLNFATFCHISGFKHKDIKPYFFVKNQQQVGHNHEVERHLLDISNFLNKSKLKNWACKIIQPP